MSKFQNIEQALKYTYVKENINGFRDPLNLITEQANNYVREAFMSTSAYKLYDLHKKGLIKIDSELERNFPVYKTIKNYLNDITEIEAFKQLSHWFHSDKFVHKEFKNKLLTAYQLAVEERNKIDDSNVAELDRKLKKIFNKDEIIELNKMYGISGIFNLSGSLYNDLMSGKSIDILINEIKLANPELSSPNIESIAKNLANAYNGENMLKSINNTIKDPAIVKRLHKKIYQLATLYSLKRVNNINSLITKLNDNPKIKDELYLASIGIHNMYQSMLKTTKDPDYMLSNLSIDVYSKHNQLQVVTLEDMERGKYLERAGWKILRTPTKNKLGIVYREEPLHLMEGVGTQVNYNLNLPRISKDIYNKYKHDESNIIITSTNPKYNTYLLNLTLDEKRKLGLIENPAHTLYRTLSKYKFYKDTQIIRDSLLNSTYTYKVNKKDPIKSYEHIKRLIDIDGRHPLFLKIEDNFIYQNLPEYIKKEYKQVVHISNISGFKDKVTLVRKDVEPWLMGYKKVRANSPVINKFIDVWQQLVLMGKIHGVVNNPGKLALDGVSNISLLLTKGIPLDEIRRQIPKVNKQLLELQRLKDRLVYAKIQANLDPSKQKEVDEIENKLKKHPLNFVYYNGMQQSLTTDIIMKNFDTVTGLQANVDNIVKHLTMKEDKETLNKLGNIINWYMQIGAKHGLTTDNLLIKLSNIGDKGILKETINEIADSIKKTRDSKDVVRFVSNFLNVPSNESTKFGGAIMQYTDVISRVILYRHLRNQGIKNNEAIQEVMDTFIDYRPNMPKELQFASDMFFIPFPYFMFKVQKVIANMLATKPISAGGQLVFDMMMPNAVGQTNIFGSNVLEKYIKDQIIANPTKILDVATYF